MSRAIEIRTLLIGIERRMKPLEWDLNRKQINEYKKIELTKLKHEQETLLQELQTLAPQN
ncbi:TPA: hypothetical protein HA241_00175 [Candidatus Woesearchaeota archaeon]|nr:hypothetical protein [Candidatus Woesearchaeota archaeon]